MRFVSRKTYQRLNQMIDEAAAGKFQETAYSESELSKLESKWKNYLSASQYSREQLKKEQDRVKGLVSDISHQTKTPLSNIKLYTELLKERIEEPPCRELLECLKTQTDYLEFLISSLVKMSRLESGSIQILPKKQKLRPLLEELERMGTALGRKKEISIQVEKAETDAVYDRKWTREALGNMIENAVKYSPAKSRISIRTESYEMFVRIEIADQGIGIEEQEMAQIFQRFYRSPRVQEQEGIGLGLYLAREILMRERGYIKVSSQKGKGSSFYCYLLKEEG